MYIYIYIYLPQLEIAFRQKQGSEILKFAQ